jgi:hypothetical protein
MRPTEFGDAVQLANVSTSQTPLTPPFGNRMNIFTAFRLSVISAPVIALSAIAYTLLATPTFSQDWQVILAWSGDGGILLQDEQFSATDMAVMVTFVAFAIVSVINQIALFFYWRPSRLILLILTILGFAATPFLGLSVSPPFEALAIDTSVFLSGFALALAYYSPVAERFTKALPNNPMDQRGRSAAS